MGNKKYQYGGDNIQNNNETTVIIRCRINNNTNELLKVILDKLKINQQDFLEARIRDFIFDNMSIIVDNIKEDKKSNGKG